MASTFAICVALSTACHTLNGKGQSGWIGAAEVYIRCRNELGMGRADGREQFEAFQRAEARLIQSDATESELLRCLRLDNHRLAALAYLSVKQYTSTKITVELLDLLKAPPRDVRLFAAAALQNSAALSAPELASIAARITLEDDDEVTMNILHCLRDHAFAPSPNALARSFSRGGRIVHVSIAELLVSLPSNQQTDLLNVLVKELSNAEFADLQQWLTAVRERRRISQEWE